MFDIAIMNIFFSVVAVALLGVGLLRDIKFAKLPETPVLKVLWLWVILVVCVFIFGFSSLAVSLTLKYLGVYVRSDVINNIVAFTFLAGGVWMSSMIILEYKIVQGAEEKSGGEKMLREVEKKKSKLEAAMAGRMAEVEKQAVEIKKNQDILLQKETEMDRIKKEIFTLESKSN
ncbi:MAG: hypothetical protein WC238_02140 [Parcubacteria group bacterium]|jgi:hypothetical protein